MNSVAANQERVNERRTRLCDRTLFGAIIECTSYIRAFVHGIRSVFSKVESRVVLNKNASRAGGLEEPEDTALIKKSRFTRPVITIGAGIVLTVAMVQSVFASYTVSIKEGNSFQLSTNVNEGTSRELDLRIETPDNNNRSVEFMFRSLNTKVLRVSPESITVTSFIGNISGTGREQFVDLTATALHDGNNINDCADIEIKNTRDNSVDTITVCNADDDATSVSGTIDVTPSGMLNLTEGGASQSISVKLSAVPNDPVTVEIARSNGSTNLSSTSMNFDASNYSTVQTLTISAPHDDDASNNSTTLTFSAIGGITAPDVTRQVNIADDDQPSFDVTSTSLTIDEGGQATFQVRPATRPSENFAVWVLTASIDITVDADSNTTGNQMAVPFTRGTNNPWNEYRTVTIFAREDNDKDDESGTITLRGRNSGDYNNIEREITFTVEDDDKPQGTFNIFPMGTLNVGEGAGASFSVGFDGYSTVPSANVTVSFSKTNPDVTFSPTSMTFTPSNMDTSQVLSVSASHDSDAVNETDTITFSATGGIIAPNATRPVYITDDETPSGAIQVTPSGTLNIGEGNTATLSVKLNTAPTSDAIVSLSKTNTDVTFSSASLTFTASNYSTAQSVTISVAEDSDTVHETDTITLSASGGISASNVTRSVAITDNDKPSGTIEATPTGTLSIDEGSSQSLSIKLGSAPNADVTVSLSKTNSDVSFSSSSLTFTTSNYATAQTVTVSVAEDNADTAHESDTITLSASGGIIAPNVTRSVSITDNDKPSGSIEVTPSGALTIGEGNTATLSVSLSVAPNADVTVALSKSNADVSLSSSSLTFTDSNYSTAQTVTVTASQDDDATDDADTIGLSASGGIIASAVTRAVTITDDDEPGFDLDVSSLAMDEGEQKTFKVRPSFRPSANITLTVTASDSQITIDTDPDTSGNQNTLAFNQYGSTNAWNRHREVSVQALHDDDASDATFSISIEGSGGNYQGETASIGVAVTDDETPPGNMVFSHSGLLNLTEGTPKNIFISLRPDPNTTSLKGDVTISLTNEKSNVTFFPSSLTFTPTNYSTLQNFSVIAVEDADFSSDFDGITIAASGGIIAPSVKWPVVIIDNDSPPVGTIVVFDSQTPPISEGDSVNIGISLSKAPVGNATVSLSSDGPDIIISPPSLTFTASNYSNARSVSIMARQDDDIDDEIATITIEISGGGFSASPLTYEVLAIDDDKPQPPTLVHNYDGTLIIAPEGDLIIDEGGEGRFEIRLSTQPKGDVSVRISKITSTSGIAMSPDYLTFTQSNWNENQSINFIAHGDSDKDDTIHGYTLNFEDRGLIKYVIVNDTDRGVLKAQALALPPPASGDGATLRVQCKQDSPCPVAFDCAAQIDGTIYQGSLPEPIPKHGARSYTMKEIQDLMGWGSWGGKGRLECSLRSDAAIGAQVWTRSGDGVLVNNSAMIRSVRKDGIYRADIESIPSPDSTDESNIRIRCNSDAGDCPDTLFVCYLDNGKRLSRWNLGQIDRRTTRHLQSEELASKIGHRWEGMGLGCEISSKGRFTVQVLTRTGGGGALVNNSATGE
ncbi:beta strand repeat-containing protein [Thioalkalivibrio sp. HK1]|uniref:beta strand repeat-containing protein n=1 Tax=Thioalkalivibrio sp. HK1 TaxID=1469245 RepID=UPI0004B7FD77|nr:hypothetical protein [Thioalkalivibrio sp. HK1]